MIVPLPHAPTAASGILPAAAMGIIAGLGPCAAPRILALTGFTHRESGASTALLATAFTIGNGIVYLAFGCLSSLASHIFDLSPFIFAAVAIALIFSGVYALRSGSACTHVHRRVNAGGAFLLGLGSASIASPCCTPMLFAVLAMASQDSLSPATALLLASFAIGSVAPSLLLVALASRVATRCTDLLLEQLRPLHAGLLIGIGAYYGVLA